MYKQDSQNATATDLILLKTNFIFGLYVKIPIDIRILKPYISVK